MSTISIPSTKPALSPEDLLSSLLASFAKQPPAARKPAPKKAPPAPLPLDKAFAKAKTGYTTWKATSRLILLEEQVCLACGSRHTSVKNELFVLENNTSHSVWSRPEGYGIEEPDHLPITSQLLPERTVSRCATCISPSVELALDLLFNSPHQLCLDL